MISFCELSHTLRTCESRIQRGCIACKMNTFVCFLIYVQCHVHTGWRDEDILAGSNMRASSLIQNTFQTEQRIIMKLGFFVLQNMQSFTDLLLLWFTTVLYI